MKKLTKREKVIIGIGVVAVAAISVKLTYKVSFANIQYNSLANKLLSGGVWKATDITDKTFKLVAVSCCGGCKK